MYSSATKSSSASGLRGGALLVGEDFGEGEGEEAEGEDVGAGGDFGLGERGGFSVGDGEAFCNGLTGPVGRSGGDGFAVGVGDGDGAAARIGAARETSSAKMNRRDLMGAAARPP